MRLFQYEHRFPQIVIAISLSIPRRIGTVSLIAKGGPTRHRLHGRRPDRLRVLASPDDHISQHRRRRARGTSLGPAFDKPRKNRFCCAFLSIRRSGATCRRSHDGAHESSLRRARTARCSTELTARMPSLDLIAATRKLSTGRCRPRASTAAELSYHSARSEKGLFPPRRSRKTRGSQPPPTG